jgi:hypothetical protein
LEKEMLIKILDFNYKVKDEAIKLEDTAKADLYAIKEEISKE